VPAERLTLQEALVLAHARWQIELLFKLWKSQGGIDESRSTHPWRILCELCTKLLAMVIQHWVLLTSCWRSPDRSLVKAAQTVRGLCALAGDGFGWPRAAADSLGDYGAMCRVRLPPESAQATS
jgi:hypothetical protein